MDALLQSPLPSSPVSPQGSSDREDVAEGNYPRFESSARGQLEVEHEPEPADSLLASLEEQEGKITVAGILESEMVF